MVLAATCLVLSACGDDDEESATTDAPADTGATEETERTGGHATHRTQPKHQTPPMRRRRPTHRTAPTHQRAAATWRRSRPSARPRATRST